jgi:hypothetical protein
MPAAVLGVGSVAITIRSASVLPAPVYAPEAQLDYVLPGELTTVLGRSPASYGEWFYVETERGIRGYAYASYLSWEGKLGSLPTVRPVQSTVTVMPYISPTVLAEPLVIEHLWWGSLCIDGKRAVIFDIKVKGGSGSYEFYWDGIRVEAEPNLEDPGVFVIIRPGGAGWVTGTIEVVSGDQSLPRQASGQASGGSCS